MVPVVTNFLLKNVDNIVIIIQIHLAYIYSETLNSSTFFFSFFFLSELCLKFNE